MIYTPIIETSQGPVMGEINAGVNVFRGIPYGEPPLGRLRFAPPAPHTPWTETRDCTSWGHCAIQTPSVLTNTMPSEDCLYLNIWTPADLSHPDPTVRYPVLFFIHGGGYFNGCGTMPYYDGTPFANNGIIVVTIEYRLGALGFLALSTLLEEFGTTGNWGTLDQIAALQWVHDNIEAFGGDKHNVTLSGESAGAFSVSNLIMSPHAQGLFRRVIMESGSNLGNPLAVPFTGAKLEPSIEMSEKFAEAFDADDSEAGLAKLRTIDPFSLWQTGFFSSDITQVCPFAFWAVQDGAAIPAEPLTALEKGEVASADYLIGTNKNEGAVFTSPLSLPESATRYLHKVYNPHAYKKLLGFYHKHPLDPAHAGSDPEPLALVRDVVTYGYFKAGAYKLADELTRHGNPAFVYEFDFTPDGNYPLKADGAHHAAELPFVFGTEKISGLTPGEAGLFMQKQMHLLWCNFITNGNPNIGLEVPAPQPQWAPYVANDRQTYYLAPQPDCAQTKNMDKIRLFQDIAGI